MPRHLSDELLERFTEGTLGDAQAALLAAHLDECPHCAARALRLDPLAPAFAALPDPRLPVGFEGEVLAALERAALAPALDGATAPARPAFPGLPLLGAGLILAALVLLAAAGEPTALLWSLGSVLRAAWVALALVVRLLPSSTATLAACAAIATACSFLAFRLLSFSRESA